MMGSTHAITGTAAWATLAAASSDAGIRPHWQIVAAGALACAGAALMPDADHDEASFAKTFHAPGQHLARWIARRTGGHRGATHSLAATAAAVAVTWLGVKAGGAWFALPVLGILYSVALRAWRVAIEATLTLSTLATIAAWSVLSGDYSWLPGALGLGALAHIAGDCLTPEGCPVFWPRPTRYALPVIKRTGSRLELRLISPACAIFTLVMLALAWR